MDPKVVEDCLESFVLWIEDQAELPRNIDKILLVRYLKASEFDLEKAKKLLTNSLHMRHKNPHIFTQRDPFSKEIQNVIEIVQLVPLADKTPENYNVTIIRLIDDDPDKINFNDIIKAFYLGGDLRLATTDEIWADGEVPVFDMNNVTLRHLTKIVFQTLRLFMKYSQEAHPVVVRQIHIVNCSSLLNRVMLILKPFLKAEVAERIQTHLPGSKTLFKYIPNDILPKEYGGTAGSIESTRMLWLQNLENQREYLNNEENWRLNLK